MADLFAAFRAGGSAYQVVAALRGRRFPLRAYGGVWAGQLHWGRLTHARVLGVLANPAYAGTYVFGRYHSRRVVEPDGTVRTKVAELPREDWPVVIHGHHPGYISWDDYLANQARLAANLTNAGARPPREGQALCQGIIDLRVLRAADDDALPPQRPRRLRMLGFARRPHGDADVPVDQCRHRRRGGGREAPCGSQP